MRATVPALLLVVLAIASPPEILAGGGARGGGGGGWTRQPVPCDRLYEIGPDGEINRLRIGSDWDRTAEVADRCMEFLLDRLDSDNPRERQLIYRTIGKSMAWGQDERSIRSGVDVLSAALWDESEEARSTAVRWLQWAKPWAVDGRTRDRLLELARSGNTGALPALAVLGDNATLDGLLEMLDAVPPGEQPWMLECAAGRLGHQPAYEACVARLREPDRRLRIHVIRSASWWGDDRVVRRLFHMLAGEPQTVDSRGKTTFHDARWAHTALWELEWSRSRKVPTGVRRGWFEPEDRKAWEAFYGWKLPAAPTEPPEDSAP